MVEIGLHGPMMRPFIGHEVVQFLAGVIAAVTAKGKLPLSGTFSEWALSNPVIDAVTEAAITVRCPACTAIETAGTAFQIFHRLAFIDSP